MSAGWEFFLGRSSDMAIIARITDATNKSLNPVFNQKGSFSCTIRIDSAAALLVDKWKHCIMVQRPNGTLAWSGPITGIVDSANEGTTTLTAQGWLAELDYRWIRSISELQDAVAYTIPIPTYPNPSFAASNTNNWTTTGSTKNADTGTYHTAPAALRWDNTGVSDNLTAGDTLATTLTGKFFAGVAYYFQFYVKASAVSTGDFKCQFGNITGGDYVELTFAVTTSFAVKNWTWIPKADYDAADLKFTAVAGGKYYWVDTFTIQDSLHDNDQAFANPSFTTNTNGWTATTSTITRDTFVMDSGVASGCWDNTGVRDNLGAGDVLEATLNGTFYKGITYTATVRIKSSSTSAGTFPLLFSFGYPGDKSNMWIEFKTTNFTTYSISWTPTATVTSGVTFGMLISVTSPYFYVNIDSCDIDCSGGRSVFTNVNDGKIAEALVRLANLQTDSGGTVRATHLTPVATSTTPRTRTYQVGQNIGAAIRELSEIENGFDIDVDPTTRNITFEPNTSYVDQTDVTYGYKTIPNNLEDVIVNDDGTVKANSINVQGAYIIGNADDLTDIADVGIIMEDWLSASDIKDDQVVGAYANEEIVFRKDGQVTIAAKPAHGAPMPYIDYDFGDKVYVSSQRGRMQLDRQPVRVFSGRISWNAQNEPIIDELGLTP